MSSLDELLMQQVVIARDSFGRRWVKCDACGKRSFADDFVSYGGKGRINRGLCRDCYRLRGDRR